VSGLSTTCGIPPLGRLADPPRPERRRLHHHQVSSCECCSEDSPALHFRRCPRCGRAFEPTRTYRRTRGQTLWSFLRDLFSLPIISIDNASKLAWLLGDTAIVIAIAIGALTKFLH